MDSPVGGLVLVRNERGLAQIAFREGPSDFRPNPAWRETTLGLEDAVEQLRAYFAGELATFDLPLAPEGTPFQQRVWTALREVSCGATVTYGELAQRLGLTNGARAVGAANGRNPLPIMVPCHRVIGGDGKLTGYAGGVAVKEALLAHERRYWAPANTQLTL